MINVIRTLNFTCRIQLAVGIHIRFQNPEIIELELEQKMKFNQLQILFCGTNSEGYETPSTRIFSFIKYDKDLLRIIKQHARPRIYFNLLTPRCQMFTFLKQHTIKLNRRCGWSYFLHGDPSSVINFRRRFIP